MTSGQRTTNVWVVGCAVAALFFAGYATRLVATDVVVCHEELKEIPEPGDWRAWNRAPDFGVYEVNGERGPCVLHGLQCALENSELRSPTTCPSSGVSLEAYFRPAGIYQSQSDLFLRQSADSFVVTSRRFAGDETFVVAFRPHKGRARPVFRHWAEAVLFLAALTAIVALVATVVQAIRRARRASSETLLESLNTRTTRSPRAVFLWSVVANGALFAVIKVARYLSRLGFD